MSASLPNLGPQMWNQRYSAAEFAFGTEPNGFLTSVADRIPKGRVLCLAAGEGRNAVYLAQLGCEVTAVDSSEVGLDKAQRLASDRGVTLKTTLADLADYTITPHHWDAIVSIFAHVPPEIRKPLHRQVVDGLRSGGVFVLEAYTPQQLQYGTGGPPIEELTMSLETLKTELAGLAFQRGVETEREVVEGKYHSGQSALVQVLAAKP